MSRLLVLPFVLAALFFVAGTPRARACSCIKERSELEQRLRSADLVLFGTITELRTERGFHHLSVQITQVLKGVAPDPQIEIVTATDDGGCGVKVAVGESYLLWPGWLSWPRVLEEPQRAIDTCNGGYQLMSPTEFEIKRAELAAAALDPQQDAGAEAGVAAAGGSPAQPQAASAAPASDDDAGGCALSGRRRDSSAVWLWLITLALLFRARRSAR